MQFDADAKEAIELLAADRVRAHEVIFRTRHEHKTAPFQREIIEAFHSKHPRIVIEAFRKGGKSTISEEALALMAALGEFKNALLIGASYERACERLESIRHELETNQDLEQIFGQLRGAATWTTDRLVLSNGIVIQAKGAGQSLRGVKYHNDPPDFVVIDDLEDEESVRTPDARRTMLRWLQKTLISALTRNARIRFIGNRLDPDAVIVKMADDKQWKALRYPIMFKDLETGEDRATWEEGFPLAWCYERRAELQRQGLFEDWNQEYMCEADAPEARVFRADHFAAIVKPRVRTWEATWAMVDPARSVGKRSATTAIPVWSWINHRLVVWDCFIGQWLPDEIIQKMLWVDNEYAPVVIGVEEDALNQFILQPLRQAQVKHGRPLPLRAMAARRFTQGRGKEDFIKSLQPFFAAGEVEFAKPMPELEAQFKSFPKGMIDGPNALAYALKMRPGAVIYEDFSRESIAAELPVSRFSPVHLALNATQSYVTAVLLQHDGSRLNILGDYVDEGDPGQIAASVVRRAQIDVGGAPLRVMAPAQHFGQWTNVGLRAALARIPIECTQGGDAVQGREELRGLFRSSVRGYPAVQIAQSARWVLNALAGGYCRQMGLGGALVDRPEDNLYAKLMEGLESFLALTRIVSGRDNDPDANLRASADGRMYRSAMVDRRR